MNLAFSLIIILSCFSDTVLGETRSSLNGSIVQRERAADRLAKEKKWAKVIEILYPYSNQLSEKSLLHLAMAFAKTNDFEKEVKILEGIEEKSSTKNYELYYILGLAQLRYAQKLDPQQANLTENKAVNNLRQVILLKSDFKPAYDQLVSYFNEKKQLFESLGVLSDMVTKFGERPEILNDLCRIYTLEGYFDQAQANCIKAIKKSPKYSENYIFYAKSLSDQGDDLKASQALIKAAQRFPASQKTQAETGQYYLEKKNYPVAIRYFEKALKIDPKLASSHLGIAKAQLELENYEASLTHFKTACQLEGQYQQEMRQALAVVRQKNLSLFDKNFSQALLTCRSPASYQK